MNEPITKALYLKPNLLSSDYPVKDLHRQSSPRNKSNKQYDKSLVTKEEVKIWDFASVPGSEAFEKTRDCVDKPCTDQLQVCNSANCTSTLPLYEKQKGFEVAMPEAVTSVKEAMGQEEVYAALDLSLPKTNVRDNKEKCIWDRDPEYQISLIMEVDEIKDDTQNVEVVQDDDDEIYWSDLGNDHMSNFHLENWDQCPSTSHVAIPSTYGSVMCPDPKDTLLIDDQGIPYTLTPDGQRVPQIDLSEIPVTGRGSTESDIEMSSGIQDADPDRELLILKGSATGVSTDSSQATIEVEKKSPNDSMVETEPPALTKMSTLPSLPIQIMASDTDSNTPILLLPPSHLQTLTASTTNAKSELMALSLPFGLASNTQSTPVVLVLSSTDVSCGIQSSSLSGHFPSVSSASSVAPPSSSSSPGPKPEPVSSTTAINLSGQNKSCNYSAAPTSPIASSRTSSVNSSNLAKQLKTNTCSDMPTSFQEALLRLAVSAEQKNENRPKGIDKSAVFEATQAPEEHEQVSPASEPDSVSLYSTDSLFRIPTEDLPLQSSISPPSPDSPKLFSNHSKKEDPQALGPRRILYCQYCPRVFYYLSDLERHSITHSQKKPHVCQLCSKAFKRSSHLERHKHIHTGERNFECQLCPRRFREAAELTRHQRVHTGEKPYQCLLCHMRFAERNTLRRHTKRKHQGQQQEAMNTKVKPEADGVSLVGMHEQQEENAEWYISTLTEMESDNDTGGE
ncbi:transcription factor Sp2 [Silurus meridionalis]|nr:transcription factor Sp2 [Silurus meridionalis]